MPTQRSEMKRLARIFHHQFRRSLEERRSAEGGALRRAMRHARKPWRAHITSRDLIIGAIDITHKWTMLFSSSRARRLGTPPTLALSTVLVFLAGGHPQAFAQTTTTSRQAATRTPSPSSRVATRAPSTLSDARKPPADTTTERMRSDDPFGLAPCEDRTAPGCFVLKTPFPSTTSDACELRAPPEVTLDGDPLRVLSHAFDGARVSFEVDIRSALLDADARPGDVPSLEVRAPLACPKDTYDAATANLGTSATVVDPATPGRVSWIFPFNFFLVEEFAILADSIEALVEAGDNLQITVTGDDGSEEFLYGGLSFPLFPRDGEDEIAIDPIQQMSAFFQNFADGAQAAVDDALSGIDDPPQIGLPAFEGETF